MVLNLLFPMVVAVVAAFGAARMQRRLRPDWATWTLTVLSGGAALAVLWALMALATGFAAEQPGLARVFGWCDVVFSSHDRVPAPVGIECYVGGDSSSSPKGSHANDPRTGRRIERAGCIRGARSTGPGGRVQGDARNAR